MVKPSQKRRRIKLLIYAVTNSWLALWYPRHFFHSFCGTFAACIDREGLVLFLRFWEIDVGEQQKYEKIIQEFVDNTGNDLHHEIVSKLKISKTFLFFFFFILYFYSCKSVFKIPKNSIPSAIFTEANTTKHRYASTKVSVFVNWRGEFRTLTT